MTHKRIGHRERAKSHRKIGLEKGIVKGQKSGGIGKPSQHKSQENFFKRFVSRLHVKGKRSFWDEKKKENTKL